MVRRVQHAILALAFKYDQGFAAAKGPHATATVKLGNTVAYDMLKIVAVPIESYSHPYSMTTSSMVTYPGNHLFNQLDDLPILEDERTFLALELFSEAHYERPRSKFILLVTILEILAAPPGRPKHVLDWMQPVIQTVKQLGATDTEFSDLHNSLSYTGVRSFSSSISRMVKEVMTNLKLSTMDAERWVKAARKIYNLRSKMVHEGKRPEIDEIALGDCQRLVRIILSHKTGITHAGQAPSLAPPEH